MSKTIFGKVIAAIVSLFVKKWPDFVAKLRTKIPEDLYDKMLIGIKVVELLKQIVNSPVADVVTSIIPGDLDDKIKEKLRQYLNMLDLDKYDMSYDPHKHLLASEINNELLDIPDFDQVSLTTSVAYQAYKKSLENSNKQLS